MQKGLGFRVQPVGGLDAKKEVLGFRVWGLVLEFRG